MGRVGNYGVRFEDTTTTEINTLAVLDALPIEILWQYGQTEYDVDFGAGPLGLGLKQKKQEDNTTATVVHKLQQSKYEQSLPAEASQKIALVYRVFAVANKRVYQCA